MNRLTVALTLMLNPCCTVFGAETTRAGIPLDASWKANLYRFAQKHSTHTAWGLAHSERDYLLSLRLAKEENLVVDSDVLFAAALLHDIGAQEPFAKESMKHEPRAVQVMEPILKDAGFPMGKQSALVETILHHMYYSKPGSSPEAIVFRDADTLDGLGAIGAVRVFSTGGRDNGWAPTLKDGLERLEKWQTDLPQSLSTPAARKIAQDRVEELRHFLDRLQKESINSMAL